MFVHHHLSFSDSLFAIASHHDQGRAAAATGGQALPAHSERGVQGLGRRQHAAGRGALYAEPRVLGLTPRSSTPPSVEVGNPSGGVTYGYLPAKPTTERIYEADSHTIINHG